MGTARPTPQKLCGDLSSSMDKYKFPDSSSTKGGRGLADYYYHRRVCGSPVFNSPRGRINFSPEKLRNGVSLALLGIDFIAFPLYP